MLCVLLLFKCSRGATIMSFIIEKVIEYFGVCRVGSSITKVLQTFDDLVCTFTV